MYHEAEHIQIENAHEGPEFHRWVAVHQGCGGRLDLVDADDGRSNAWICDKCGVSFEDDHCADVIAERRDAAARNAASELFATGDEKDAHRATKQLEKERKSIRSELLEKRAARMKARAERRADPAPLLKEIAAATSLDALRAVVDKGSGQHWSDADADALRTAVNRRVGELQQPEPAAAPTVAKTKPPPPDPEGEDTRSPLEIAMGAPRK